MFLSWNKVNMNKANMPAWNPYSNHWEKPGPHKLNYLKYSKRNHTIAWGH